MTKEDCRLTRGLLMQHLDGELDPETTERVNAHLASCPGCRYELERLEQLDRLVRESEPPLLAGEYWDWHRQQVWRRIRPRDRSLRARTVRGRFRALRLATFVTGVAAAVLLVVIGWRLLSEQPGPAFPEWAALEDPVAEEPHPPETPADRLPATPLPTPEDVPGLVAGVAPPTEEEQELAALLRRPMPEEQVRADKKPTEELPAETAGKPGPVTPEAALARYRAFAESVERRAEQVRTLTADTADRPPQLTAPAPLPPAPGPDSVTVSIRVLVGPDGLVHRLELLSGSGEPKTDSLVRLAVTRSRFQPGYRHGVPAPAWFEAEYRLAPVPETDSNH